MTDKNAPKSNKPAKDKGAKKAPGPKLVAKDVTPGVGHNSVPNNGEKNPEAIAMFDELYQLESVQKKAIAKACRDLRNGLKTKFNILSSSVARELALRKLDADVRVQVETNHDDFKRMLGYQPSLDFTNGVATTASAKAQPSEGELERNTEPTRGPKPPAGTPGFTVADNDEDETDGAEGGVITREG